MNRARWILGLVVAGLVLGTSVFSFASAAEQDLPTYGQPALQAIDQARAAGEISRSEALLYRLYYVVAPDLLPAEFALPGPGMKDGTGIWSGWTNRLPAISTLLQRGACLISRA